MTMLFMHVENKVWVKAEEYEERVIKPLRDIGRAPAYEETCEGYCLFCITCKEGCCLRAVYTWPPYKGYAGGLVCVAPGVGVVEANEPGPALIAQLKTWGEFALTEFRTFVDTMRSQN